MAKRRKLDKHVSVFVDRHGKERFRFRKGDFSTYLPHPSDRLYREAYKAALEQRPVIRPRSAPGTIDDALPRYYESMKFKQGGEGWRKDRRRILEAFRAEYGRFEVREFEPHLIDRILAKKLEQRVINGRKVGGSAAAVRLREQLLLFFKWAAKQKLVAENPVEDADTPAHKGSGFYRWTEGDIAKFRKHWALGTKPRLALELMLWTGTRRGDARLLPPPRNGRFVGNAGKTGKEFDMPVAPPLTKAIEAMAAVGMTTLLVTEYGKPFSAAGFGNWFKDQCRKAGLPQCTAHGLRKALTRRGAEAHVPQQGLKALGQWSDDREVATYVAGVNQTRLRENAIDAIWRWERDANIV
jgi:integrase